MAYTAWSVTFGEQPSASKWNQLGSNDASFNDGTGIGAVLGSANFLTGVPVQTVASSTTAVATGTTILPYDDTIPQNTEGDQYMTQAITPKSATNRLSIEAVIHIGNSASDHLSAALFQDSTANALAVASQYQLTNQGITNIKLTHDMVSGTTSSTTFKIRAGNALAGTTTVNGLGGARRFGGVFSSSMKITEYKG
jgi:hypothetical protein